MSIARNTLAYWLTQVGVLLISIAASAVVARKLGVEGRGLVASVILANTLAVNLTNLGLHTLSMYFVGKRADEISRTHTLVLLIVGLIVLLDIAIFAIGGPALRSRIFRDVSETSTSKRHST